MGFFFNSPTPEERVTIEEPDETLHLKCRVCGENIVHALVGDSKWTHPQEVIYLFKSEQAPSHEAEPAFIETTGREKI